VYAVRVVSTEAAQGQIAAAGLAGVALLPGRDAEIRAIVEPDHAVGSHPLRLHAQVRANLAVLADFRDALRALWQTGPPDLLIADFTVPVAGAVARELGVPWWTTHPSCCVIETPDGPPAYLGGWRPGRGPLGRLRDAGGRRLIRLFKRAIHRLHRTQVRDLGFPSIYRDDGSEALYSDERVLAFGLAELELARRWPAAVELVGPVLYTPPSEAPEPPFVPGRDHVLVTLGTHLQWRKEAMVEAVRRAAAALPGIELHWSDGDVRSTRRESAGNFHRLGYVPYDRDLPRYALVVHHGGAGVMYHTLRAGLPALVLPVDYDQFDHAVRLETAGAARRLRRPEDLATQVADALGDAGLRAAGRRFRDILAAQAQAPEERVAQLVAQRLGAPGPFASDTRVIF
jgi:UDP:flavonoid glycosyltransferase YjiC (YdhE family)